MNKVYNRIESIIGNVITVRANDVKYKELAQINTRFGKSLAQVNKIEGDVDLCQFLILNIICSDSDNVTDDGSYSIIYFVHPYSPSFNSFSAGADNLPSH